MHSSLWRNSRERRERRPVVVFAGGGSGGHLYPALAIADALRSDRPEVKAVFMGARRGIEARILPQRGELHHLFKVRSFDRSRRYGFFAAIALLKLATTRALLHFHRLRPCAVVATGGFAAAPASLAAIMLGVPLVVQEQNAYPGLVLRVLSRWAAQVHIAFPEARKHMPRRARERSTVSGNPVRPPNADARAEVRNALGVAEDTRLVVVTGGSQGARAINSAMLDWARGEAKNEDSAAKGGNEGPVVLWAYGRAHRETLAGEISAAGAGWLKAVSYIEDLPSTFAAADLAVGRAGAMTTAEICNAALPAILVPLPTAAANHQAINARALADAGAVRVIEETELSAASLAAAVHSLLRDEERLAKMSSAARVRARPEASHRIACAVARFLPPTEGI